MAQQSCKLTILVLRLIAIYGALGAWCLARTHALHRRDSPLSREKPSREVYVTPCQPSLHALQGSTRCGVQMAKDELVQSLRKQSRGYHQNSSKFRGVTKHQKGKWEARIGQARPLLAAACWRALWVHAAAQKSGSFPCVTGLQQKRLCCTCALSTSVQDNCRSAAFVLLIHAALRNAAHEARAPWLL